jgi:hypothetical protein
MSAAYSSFLSVGVLPLSWTAHTDEQDGATAVLAGVTSTLLIPLCERTGLNSCSSDLQNTLLNIGTYVTEHTVGRLVTQIYSRCVACQYVTALPNAS